MRVLTEQENDGVLTYFEEALHLAKQATCQRSQCGSVIVKDEVIIGRGYNSPPGDRESQRRCSCSKENLDRKVTDKTCCIHAEQRAIMDALKANSQSIEDARLYFIRINNQGTIMHAGQPYCTLCSKMALDAGLSEFVLWHKEGITVYDTEEYNTLSYKYQECQLPHTSQ